MANKPTLRLKILTLFIQDSKLSQTQVMKLLKRTDHGNISEECRSLEKAGFLKVHHKELNGGRPEIFYRITNDGVCYLIQNSQTPTEFWTSLVLLVYYENKSISWQKILELFELYLKKYLKHYLKEGYYSIQLDDFNSSCHSWFEKAILGRKISLAQKVLEVLAKNPDLSLDEISRVTQERVSTIEPIIKMYTPIPHKPVLVDVYGRHDSPFYDTADWRFQIHNAIIRSNSKGTFKLTIFGILMVLFIILKNHQGKLPQGLMEKDDVQSYFDKIASNYKSAIPLIFERWKLLKSFLKEYSYLNFSQILDRRLREKSFDSSVLDGGTKEIYIGMRETTIASRRQLIELQTAGMNVIFNFHGMPGNDIDFEDVQKKIQPCFHLFLYLISIINPTNYDPETFISIYSNEKYLGNRLAEEIGSIFDVGHLEKSLSFEISFIYYLSIRNILFHGRFTSDYSKQLFTKIIKSDEEIGKFIQERLARIQNYYKEVERSMGIINQ